MTLRLNQNADIYFAPNNGKTQYGVYKNDNEKTKIFGNSIWTSSLGRYYKSSIKKINQQYVLINNVSEDLNVYFDGEKWIMGQKNSPTGWWELDEKPVNEKDFELKFKKLPDTDAKGENYNCKWNGYNTYSMIENGSFYIGEVGLWK